MATGDHVGGGEHISIRRDDNAGAADSAEPEGDGAVDHARLDRVDLALNRQEAGASAVGVALRERRNRCRDKYGEERKDGGEPNEAAPGRKAIIYRHVS